METDTQLDEVRETTPLLARGNSTGRSHDQVVEQGGRSYLTSSAGLYPTNGFANGYATGWVVDCDR